MSANPTVVCDLVDADTMSNLADLRPASNRSFKPIFNGPGSFSFDLPIDCAAAYKVKKRKTGVMITRNGRKIWSGALTDIVRSAKAANVSVTATGWEEELEGRFVRKAEEAALTFATATVGGLVGKGLIDVANAQQDSSLVTRPMRVSFGLASDTQTRVRSYKQGDNYGAQFKELVEIENGFDYSVDPATKRINTRAPTAYTTRVGVQFAFGMTPNNLDDAVQTDSGDVKNRISVVASNGAVYVADDATAIAEAGVMLEEWTSLSDVVDSTGAIPAAYANAELVYKRYGVVTYQLTPIQFGDFPRPYDDFEWGDVGYLSVDKDSFQLRKQAIRLFSAKIDWDDKGNEIISDLTVAF
jgi:hypothetical protein